MLNGKKVAYYTLGCKLNFSETSTISRQLEDIGFIKTNFDNKADLYVINTCSVTENANKECRRIIRKVKRTAPESMVVITGCYAQLKPESISVIEGVDMVVGANDKFKIPDLLKNHKPKTTEIHGCSINNLDYHSSFSLLYFYFPLLEKKIKIILKKILHDIIKKLLLHLLKFKNKCIGL